jgi:Arc/MetJ family transcription regulator
MRTTLTIDDDLFQDLLKITRAKTKTDAVRTALKEYLAMKRKEKLLSMRGTLQIDETWKELRQLETVESGS